MNLRTAFVVLFALALQGCIALAAVPILASGGAMAYSGLTGERTRQAIAQGTEIDEEELERADLAEFAILPIGVLPAPDVTVPRTGPLGAMHRFTTQALAQSEGWSSALLDDPTTLTSTRAACKADIPAVLIDLDPADSALALNSGTMPDPAMVALLQDLRRDNVAIAWMTDREPQDAGRIRSRLLDTGLDPTGRDPLFVQRYPGETKQARRRALLETHCVLAIAGDDPRDFDDVYIYVRDESSTAGLQPMFGAGWFLIPNPLD